VKARAVKGLEPDGPLADNMRRVILVRLDELYGFIPDALDPADVERSHDMRIAAKRLRYVLELSEPLFGKTAKSAAKVAKNLQSMLGEIHDCDELMPLVAAHIEQLRTEDAEAAVAGAPKGAKDVDPGLLRQAPNRGRYRGLELLMAHAQARRTFLHTRFVAEWGRLERRGFREELETGLETDPIAEVPTP
jgi:hypothetical protein